MKKPAANLLHIALCTTISFFLIGCGERTRSTSAPEEPVTLTEAPPGPADLGPATDFSPAPDDAVVFDLKYRAQTGGADDIPYRSFWGYGGSSDEAKASPFLQEVRKKTSNLHYENNPSFKGREWSAVEYANRRATALYFDLNADGKLQDNERIEPTRRISQGVEFITPDFVNPLDRSIAISNPDVVFCRALLQVNFYGTDRPNCMWSPAALLEATGNLEGRECRLLLYQSGPGRAFHDYGTSSYSLMFGGQADAPPGVYFPREKLSTLITANGQFYHLAIDGRRSNGLPARVVLTKDTTSIGEVTTRLAGLNPLQSTFSTLFVRGAEDKGVHLRVAAKTNNTVTLPAGSYALNSGVVQYGKDTPREWEVSFRDGPRCTVTAGEVAEVSLGRPVLSVRAVNERDRYNLAAAESAIYKPGTRIYLEPKIVGANKEIFNRFQQPSRGRKTDVTPRITITAADGTRVLSKSMEYG